MAGIMERDGMTEVANVHVHNFAHDSINGSATFMIGCTIGTKPANVSGLLPLTFSNDLLESEIRISAKNHLADFFQALADYLRSTP
jgi:hypothetical protein